VVMLTTASQPALIAGRKLAQWAGSAEGRPLAGSRACKCKMAAPACAAAITEVAICGPVTGKYRDIDGVWIDPVMAQEMMIFDMAARVAGCPILRNPLIVPLLVRLCLLVGRMGRGSRMGLSPGALPRTPGYFGPR